MNRLEEVKKRRPFAMWDLLVYGVLILFVAALILGFALGGDSRAIEGIYITCHDETVYTYSFSQGGAVSKGWEERVEQSRSGDVVTVTVHTDGGTNVLAIDLTKKSARMTDADCSRRKDCTLMAELTRRDGAIVCVPHGIKVLALGGGEDYTHPSIG